MTTLALSEVPEGFEVFGSPQRLEALARTANHEHGLSSRAVMSMLLHGITAGEALNEAKTLVPHGEWLHWLSENVGFATTTATSYMLVARHKDFLLGCEDVRTMQQALARLREEGRTSWSYLTPELAREVADYAKHRGIKRAAREFGLNYSTVHRYAHGQLPAARLHRQGISHAPTSWSQLSITDEVIEALAQWLVATFGGAAGGADAGAIEPYPMRVTDEVRNDAVDALGCVIQVSRGTSS